MLSPCQKNALEVLRNSEKNIFLTGSAGSGKSFLMRQFLKDIPRKTYPIVASTGAAAVLVGGRTFHSFFGLGIMEGGMEETLKRALANRRVISRIKKIVGFVLDEVSMIPGPAFAAAETICRLAREVDKPWGGIRVIAVGDFAQLPPINRHQKIKEWVFLDQTWERTELNPLLLKTIMRSQDEEYMRILNFIRHGEINDEVSQYLNGKTDDQVDETHKSPYLFSRRLAVENFNKKRLHEIDNPLKIYSTEYSGDLRARELLKKNAPIPDKLHLKKSALVMIRVNDPQFRYVNGSLGTVVDLEEDQITIELSNGRIVDLESHVFSWLDADGKEKATAINFPVNLAYATTIHKAQGTTLDRLVVNLQALWETGQAYVALSRLRSGEGLTLTGWDESSIRVDPQVVRFHEGLVLPK